MDLNKLLRKHGNSQIVNKEIIELEDRNIDSIVINCYTNLQKCKLAAYSISYADSSIEFQCEFKAQIDKLRSKYKDKLIRLNEEDQRTEMEKILGMHNTSESINVRSLHNNYKILKLKYFIDPIDTINKALVLPSIEATLEAYRKETSPYDIKVDDSLDYLYKVRKEYQRLRDIGEVIPDMTAPKIDLFVKEQLVLVPIYDNDAKYTIDGLKYYGTFNNTDIGVITKKGMFGTKVFKNGKVITIYLMLQDDIFFIKSFGIPYNLFHLVTQRNACDMTWEEARDEIFPKVDPYMEQIFKNTFEHAQMLERMDPRLVDFKVHALLPDATKDNNGRATLSDTMYVKQIFNAAKDYIFLKDQPVQENERRTQFEFLGALEISIYNDINNHKIGKNSDILAAKNRINLSPLAILKVIKKGSGDSSNTLFISTSTEPNPFDLFYVTSFMKKTINTETKGNRTRGATKQSDSEKLIKYDDFNYIGEFCPKSEQNIGISTTLRVGLPSKYITKRKPLS